MPIELYVGSDESGNGAELEVHTAVFSRYAHDIFSNKEVELPYIKVREHKNLFHKLRKRAHSFLVLEQEKKYKIPHTDRTGVIMASLLHQEFDWEEVDKVHLYMDGFKKQSEINRVSEIVQDRVPKLSMSKIRVSWGAHYDCKIFVVNLADELAHFLFRKGQDYLIAHPNRKALLY
jgi:hypothetical protein